MDRRGSEQAPLPAGGKAGKHFWEAHLSQERKRNSFKLQQGMKAHFTRYRLYCQFRCFAARTVCFANVELATAALAVHDRPCRESHVQRATVDFV